MIKKIHGLSLIVLSLCLAITVKADANTGDLLKRIYDMRIVSYAILSDYYMFSGLEGDSRYNREIESGIKQFDSHLDEITASSAPTSKLDGVAKVVKSWQEYKKLLEVNRADFLTQGYANARLVDELSKNAVTLNEELQNLYDNLKQSSDFPISSQTELTRQMGIIIQTLTAEYAARSTSSLGQVMVIKINEGGMEKQAAQFDKLLAQLKTNTDKDKSIYRSLDQVEVKWEFINKSIFNYNENAVPFVISTYGDRIAQNLVSIGDHYNRSMQAKK
ncbi:hypothetical protein HF888_07650 [Bermanella marisrubri]|nr:hypothetical protein [Bermanella marisrubri]QIZ84110.1 hypothetical protein HF888_07650 [Bermanella marisrubri]